MWTALVLIILIIVVGAVMRSKHNTANGYATDQQGNPIGNSAREAELERELEELRERVRVIERIVVEERETTLLAAEIEGLRDTPPTDPVETRKDV